ncbi:ribonuclease P protein subunit p30 [Neocloeon triangulifer]|uniref:ribonuclease P protein subunit p30 n=1 Tax=Neocloeon triangulifer TaxID=2078957 RepID=UPI00286F9207|nr:ribonuclease P protein subunit p30 [Neocloeon triangulifer]
MSVGFSDLNLRPANKADVRSLCLAALEAGFKTVAVNTEVDANVFAKKGKKGETDGSKIIPEPLDLDILKKELDGRLQILQRLTVQIADSLQAHKLFQSNAVMKYDILAVQPLNPQAFQHACASMDVDIVSFDATDCAPLKAARKVVRQARERGVYFEAQYWPLVSSSATRRNTIAIMHSLHAVGRGRALVVLTSGAAAPNHLRSPYDVANLALLLGLSEESAKNCMRHATRNVLLNAQARRMGKGMVFGQVTRPVNDKIVEENGIPPTKRRKKDSSASQQVSAAG